MPIIKSTDYWKGFAEGQRDMEKQMSIENHILDPNQLVEGLDKFAAWTIGLLENNGSDEINNECAPMHADYSEATVTTIALAFAQARLVRVLCACVFRLQQGELSEEQFHHEINESLNRLDEEASKGLE